MTSLVAPIGANPEVLLISRCPPYPLHLGDRLIPHYLARELHRRGYLIDLLAFYQEPEDRADLPYYEKYFRSVTLIPEPVRTPVSLAGRALVAGRRFPARRSGSWSPAMWDAITARLQQHRHYNMVHFFGGIHVYEFRDLARRFPSIIAPYESYALLLQRTLDRAETPWGRALLRAQLAVARNYESWMYDGFGRVVVVSDKDAAVMRKQRPGLPVTVIPNGVDLDHFAPTGHEPERPVLLFTGNYEYGPNVDAVNTLIRRIFPQVKRAIPDAELLIVGNNPPPEIKALERPDIQITGRVPDLRPYFEGAMVYVSALRIGAGIKNKILEALAMRTAVVATPLSCDGIKVTHGKDVVLARRPDDLAKATIHLLQNDGLRRQIAANGRQLIEQHYTWPAAADAYEALYAAVIRDFKTR